MLIYYIKLLSNTMQFLRRKDKGGGKSSDITWQLYEAQRGWGW